jgi:hypothetical protein
VSTVVLLGLPNHLIDSIIVCNQVFNSGLLIDSSSVDISDEYLSIALTNIKSLDIGKLYLSIIDNTTEESIVIVSIASAVFSSIILKK